MPSPTIFIASSLNGRPLAEALAEILRQEMQDAIRVQEWWIDSFGLNHSTLEALIEHCRRSDFAAVLLTQDDTVVRDSVSRPAPRDNCILEAGMFLGVFSTKGKGGRGQVERCFLLTSVPLGNLLSDLHGITTQRIDETPSSQSIRLAATKIRTAIQAFGPICRPELECYTEEEVLDREQVGGGGNLERGCEVLINLTRPIEVDPVFATRVIGNLQANVHYKYFFSAAENLRLIAQLFHSVATAGNDFVSPHEKAAKFHESLARIERQLCICFLPSSRPLEFCVHNADRERAVCYLRRPDEDRRFVEWCVGDKAIEMARDVQRLLAPAEGSDRRVFRPSREFNIYSSKNAVQLALLAEEVKSLFDEAVHERVLTLCFGSPPGGSGPSRPRKARRSPVGLEVRR
jgi:hypothetical protein